MSRSAIVIHIVLFVAGVGLVPLGVKTQGAMAELDARVLAVDRDIDELYSMEGVPSEKVTEVDTSLKASKMSLLAWRQELRLRFWVYMVGGPLLALLGVAGLFRAILARPPRRKCRRGKRRRFSR